MRSHLQAFVIVIVPVVVTALTCHSWNVPSEGIDRDNDAFNPRAFVQELREERPEWVLVGNSMLRSRVMDEREFAEEAGIKTKVIAKGGSQSAIWFLILKQIIIESKARPRLVTIFFRHTDLTWADFRTTGIQADAIAQMDGHSQQEWREVLGNGGRPMLLNTLADGLDALFPSNYMNFDARLKLQSHSFEVTGIGTESSGRHRRQELNERFGLTHLRHDLGSDTAMSGPEDSGSGADDHDDASYALGPKVFDPSPKASFLPHMVALAHEHGIRLHFHRIKRRPRGDSSQSDRMHCYTADLGRWLGEHGCAFTDETGDSSLTRDMYADGDHLSADPAVQERYRVSFLDRVRPVISDSANTTAGR